jgi:hypothetical protein
MAGVMWAILNWPRKVLPAWSASETGGRLARPAADDSPEATNCHAFLSEFLAGEPPALLPGCFAGVDLEAKDLLARPAPQSGSQEVKDYVGLRADLSRRPTMTEQIHQGYSPTEPPPGFTT